jgi:hypothetical protein
VKAALLQGAWHLVTERENLASANCGADAADKNREADQREHRQWRAPIGEGRDLIRVEAKVGSREIEDTEEPAIGEPFASTRVTVTVCAPGVKPVKV